MDSQLYFWIFLGIFTIILTFNGSEALLIPRVKRQWGFGYPLFGGIGNSWEVKSNPPTYPGWNVWAGK